MGIVDASVIRTLTQPTTVAGMGQDIDITVDVQDWTGTWSGKIRDGGPEGPDTGLSVTVEDTFSIDTTLTATLPDMTSLIPSGERTADSYWLCLYRTEEPKYEIQTRLSIKQTGR